MTSSSEPESDSDLAALEAAEQELAALETELEQVDGVTSDESRAGQA